MGLGIIPRANTVSKHYISDYEAFFQVKSCMPITLLHYGTSAMHGLKKQAMSLVIGYWPLGAGR
jgi:hypothetical protein